MEIEEVKTWQWILAGLVAGLLLSCVLAYRGPAFDTQERDTIEQGEFENGTFALTKFGTITGNTGRYLQQFHKDQPMLRDVTVHPPLASDAAHSWVTGESFSIELKPVDPSKPTGPEKLYGVWKPFKYPASIPYEPGYALRQEKKLNKPIFARRNAQLDELKKAIGGESSFATVKEYLAAVATMQDNNFKFRYAWWELPAALWSLPPLAGLLCIGVAWPLALSMMQNYGLAKKPASPKAKAKPAIPQKPSRSISTGSTAGVSIKTPPPLPEPVSAEQKKYGGEFYPVVKSTHKD